MAQVSVCVSGASILGVGAVTRGTDRGSGGSIGTVCGDDDPLRVVTGGMGLPRWPWWMCGKGGKERKEVKEINMKKRKK